MRTHRLALVSIIVIAACAAGPDAPVTGTPQTLCAANFCVAHPGDWEVVEVGADFAVFAHPDAPDRVTASVGQIDMGGLAAATGRSRSIRPDAAVDAFWELLADAAAVRDGVRRRADGSVVSTGSLRDGRLWHRLVPVDDDSAVGVEVRAPNRSWQRHAVVFLDGLTVVDTQ